MNFNKVCLLIILFVALLTCLFPPVIVSAGTCDQWAAKVTSVQGKVLVQRIGETEKESVLLHDAYCPGDMILVLTRSRATIMLRNETIAHLDQNTNIVLTVPEKEEISLLNILVGAVHFFSRTPRTLDIITPFVNAGVEGTEFIVRVKDNQTVVTVFEGWVKAINKAGTLILSSGQSAIARAGQAPVSQIVVRPADAVQWALYYPPVLYYRADDFPGDEKIWHSAVRTSIRYYWDGNLEKAFESIEEVPDDIRDPRFYTYRSSLLLTVGRVDEANVDIKRTFNLQPGNSHAIALQSIISVVQNEKDKALSLAEKAVESEQDSAAALIALSYAQQANFDLSNSLESLQMAVKLEPENSLAWARLAELWQASGYISKSLTSAEKAVELNPNLARTQTVLGFAHLSQINTQASMKAFESAIMMDQGDPLPRLGLGLIKIREGKLEEGRREIETAVSLDPYNSLLRSYLGKSYFEEKRDKVAMSQYEMAKELDPLDPTPYFYDAIRKQGLNRPVEALHDMQKAIELNDNRAVYRSRQLLDEDLAARSASLARIYDNLGFQQLALVEGWKSVNTDPGNHSAHRLLADSYSVLPRHEIARVSELHQSQLLQPINNTSIQPHLAESDLFVLSSTGPGDLSFNEFNTLFNSDGGSLHVNGIAGEHRTYGEEIVISGIKGGVSLSAGQYHFRTDGYRVNNDLDQDIFNLFSQVSLSHDTSILAEFRISDAQYGDLTLNFDPEDILPNKREDKETKSIRFGLRHSFTPRSKLISTLIYKDSDASLNDFNEERDISSIISEPPFSSFLCSSTSDITTVISDDDDGYMAEVQHQLIFDRLNIISGAGLFLGDTMEVVNLDIPVSCTFPFPPFNPVPFPPLTSSSVNDTYIQHINFYIYTNITAPENMTWTVGASSDFFEGGLIDQTDGDPNPKLGLTWKIMPDMVLRAAAFRVMKRTLLSSQTIEPTQVAGFNQFFDDLEGTESWRYGIGIDRKFTNDMYGGVEFSKRELEVPNTIISSTGTSQVTEANWREQSGRIYFYWTPHERMALSSEYEYERIDREDVVSFIEEVITHRFPIGISFYHPSGFSSMLKATYINQDGRFHTQESTTTVPGGDEFWTFDASISYRLPKRMGLITIGGKNLFDKSFRFQDTDTERKNPVLQPERMIFAKFTLAL